MKEPPDRGQGNKKKHTNHKRARVLNLQAVERYSQKRGEGIKGKERKKGEDRGRKDLPVMLGGEGNRSEKARE